MSYIVSHSPRLLERSDWIPQVIQWVGPEGSLHVFPKRGSRRLDHLRRADWGDEWCRDSDTTGRFSLLLDRRRDCLQDAIWGFFIYFPHIHGQYLARVPALFRIFGSQLCRKTRRLGRGQSMGSERKVGPEAGRVILIEWLPLLPLDCPPFGVHLLSVTYT